MEKHEPVEAIRALLHTVGYAPGAIQKPEELITAVAELCEAKSVRTKAAAMTRDALKHSLIVVRRMIDDLEGRTAKNQRAELIAMSASATVEAAMKSHALAQRLVGEETTE